MGESGELQVYVNGQFMSHQQAVEALQGTDVESTGGFYDAERTFNGQVFKLRQHLERLYQGLDHAKIDPKTSLEEMEANTLRLLEANRPLLEPGHEFTITQVVSQVPSPTPDGEPRVNIVIFCRLLDFSSFTGGYAWGVRVVTPITYLAPKGSSTESGQQVLTLLTDSEGSITECAGANFMFVRDGRIMLPDRRNVLPGVSMQTVLDLAKSLGVAVNEDTYSILDVYMAEEAFVSSTRYCMLPVATLNGYRLSEELPGPITRRLLEAWRELVGTDFVQQALDHLPPDKIEAASEDV